MYKLAKVNIFKSYEKEIRSKSLKIWRFSLVQIFKNSQLSNMIFLQLTEKQISFHPWFSCQTLSKRIALKFYETSNMKRDDSCRLPITSFISLLHLQLVLKKKKTPKSSEKDRTSQKLLFDPMAIWATQVTNLIQ